MTSARLNHELKMYAKPAKIISATAKNRQIIIPAKVRYAGPITSKPKKENQKLLYFHVDIYLREFEIEDDNKQILT